MIFIVGWNVLFFGIVFCVWYIYIYGIRYFIIIWWVKFVNGEG